MFTLDELTPSLQALAPVALRLLLNKHAPDETNVSAGSALLIWTADMLSAIQPIEPEARQLLLEVFAEPIKSYGDELAKQVANKEDLKICKLGIADRQFAYVSGLDGIIDLNTGKTIPGLQLKPTEEIYYNLTTVFIKNELSIRLHRQGHNNETQTKEARRN